MKFFSIAVLASVMCVTHVTAQVDDRAVLTAAVRWLVDSEQFGPLPVVVDQERIGRRLARDATANLGPRELVMLAHDTGVKVGSKSDFVICRSREISSCKMQNASAFVSLQIRSYDSRSAQVFVAWLKDVGGRYPAAENAIVQFRNNGAGWQLDRVVAREVH